jgi:hypothetical protein
MGFNPHEINHIVIANNAGLGPIGEDKIVILDDLSSYQKQFYVECNTLDKLSALTFRSNVLNNLVSDSPLSKILYRIAGRQYRKKIVNPGDEK